MGFRTPCASRRERARRAAARNRTPIAMARRRSRQRACHPNRALRFCRTRPPLRLLSSNRGVDAAVILESELRQHSEDAELIHEVWRIQNINSVGVITVSFHD